MFSVCLRYSKNQTDAEDIFQEGFYLVYKNLTQLKNKEALSGWIKKIFVNVAIEHNRKKYQLRIVEDSDSVSNITAIDLNEAISKLATKELTILIQQLPAGCREVFNLYVVDGYPHKDIAEQLSISIGTSKSQLFDARKILKKKIIANNLQSSIKKASS